MAEIINGVPIGDLPGIESVPDDSMLVVEFLGKAYHMPGAVLRQMIQDVLDSMGDSVDDVTEARLTAAIETVLSSGKYNGVSPSVEVLDEEDGTTVIHIIDAFGDKRYPVEVKGATDAVRYKPQSLTDAQKAQARANIGALSAADISDKDNEIVIVKISGSLDAGYTVFWGDFPAPAGGLNALVENGSVVIGIADGDLTFPLAGFGDYTVPSGTVFSYSPHDFSNNGTFWVNHVRDFMGMPDNKSCVLKSQSDGSVWTASVITEQYTFYLTGDYPGRILQYDGVQMIAGRALEILQDAVNNDAPIFCFQKDAAFDVEGGGTYTPPIGTPFYYNSEAGAFRCERDGFDCTLTVGMFGYTVIAEKTTPYKTAESKADDLKEEDGTLFLLSAGEPIGAGVPLPTGSADDSKIFIADLNTSTYEDIKAADDAGKICYALWGGYTACMLTTLSPESAIFTTLLDPHLGLYVKFTKGTVGVSDFGLTESHSVLYEPQSLTDAQKAQARENIGALSADDIDVDSIGSNVFVADYDTTTFAEIKAAHDAGKVCFLNFDGLMIPLLNLGDTEAVFVREVNDTTDYKVTITSAGGKDLTLVEKNTPIYIAQTLTDDQKTQARTNIGALSAGDVDAVLQQAKDSGQFDGEDGQRGTGTLVIYSTPTAYTEQVNGLTPAYRSTRALVIDHSGIDPIVGDVIQRSYYHYPVIYVDDTYVYMSNRFSIRGAVGATGKTAYAYAQDGGYTGTEAEFAAKLASESDSVFVADYDTTTYAEVKAAHNAGKVCFLDLDGLMLPLLNLGDTEAVFVREVNDTTDYKVTFTSAGGKDLTLVEKNTPIYVAQTLTDSQKTQARSNIGAAAAADLSNYVTTGTAQTITGAKIFKAPANVAGTEQHTVKFKTSNGGAIIFGKEAADSGTMLRFDQVDGTTRLRFRGSDSAGAIVWEQPEQGAQLYVDLGKQGVDKHRINFPSSGGTLALTSQIPSLSGYLPLSGGLMTGSLKFQAASLPGKSLQYICGIDAFASGGEMGWQSKADFLSGYLTTTGTAARATADANGNNIASTYAKVTTANDYNGEQRFKNSAYCPTITDTAPGIGCAFKSSRGLVNELLADKIIATASTGKIPFYSYTGASNGSMTGLTEFAYLSPGAFILRPPSGEGGQIQLEAAANDPTNTGICIDTAGGNFRIFGLQSADGTTTTGYGSVLAIHPYAKIITGGYSFDGLAAKATADGNGRNIVSTYATKDEVVTAANGSLKVTLSGNATDGYTVDKTLAQIETALNAGRHVYMAENDGQVYQLSMHMAGMMACFTSVVATSNTQVAVNTVVVYDGLEPSVFTKTL